MRKITIVAVAGIVSSLALAAQTISVYDHRPLAALADQLELGLGAAIHYEDPRFAFAGDLEDVATEEMRLLYKAPKFKLLVPKKARITMQVQFAPFLSDPEKASQIQKAVDAYKSTGMLHEFTLSPVGRSFTISPIKATIESGELVAVSSIMATKISIPLQELPVHEALSLILDKVTKAFGIKAVVGQANFFPHQRVSVKAESEAAGLTLIKVLNQLSAPDSLSYRALYDPVLKYYMVNIQQLGGANRSTFPPLAKSNNSSVDGRAEATGGSWFLKR